MLDDVTTLTPLVVAMSSRLAELYGPRTWSSHAPPLDELIATILSQHTSDVNSQRAFAQLRARFPTWQAVASADVAMVAAAIQCGGLANLKAPRVQGVLRAVHAQSGLYSLDWLHALELTDARNWLLSLPGVGPKTAACVLLFSLGMPTMPVDTHVFRVSRRLGIVPMLISANDAHIWLDRLIGPDRDAIYSLHLNLIRHGRSICKARAPACHECVLQDLCPSAFKFSTPDGA